MSRKDILIVPVLEAMLILIVSLAGWLSSQPLVFASLGPTAFEIIETPDRPSARPYHILMGNLIAVLAAFLALWLTKAGSSASVSAAGVPLPRVWAATLAAMLTVFGTLALKATQPAAISTTLLISLGIMQTVKDGIVILAAVLLMTILGEPVRRFREKRLAV